jgi:hypothetical protein
MKKRSTRLYAALAVLGLNALIFVQLTYHIQSIADSTSASVPAWLGPAWLIAPFPGRYLYLLPALDHPFGFGEHEDRNLYLIAAFNGLIWAAATYGILAAAARRRLAR